MKKILLVVAALAVVYPAAANAASFKGVVVGKSRGSLAVAARSGAVRTVSTRAHARVGAVVVVRGRRVASGIFRASSVRVVGHARRVHIRAVFVRRLGRWSVLSAGHSLLALRSGSRALASAGQAVRPGTVVQTIAEVDDDDDTLTETEMEPVGETGSVTIQATVVSVAPGSITLQVGTQQVTLSLPAGLTLPNLAGQTVSLQLSFANGEVQAQEDEDNDDQGEDEDDDDDGGDGD